MEIQIKNTYDKKLKKEFHVVIPRKLIDTKVNDYVAKIQGNFSLKGFRKGQVPVAVIKEKYEASIAAEESDKIINDTVKKIVTDNNIKLALTPKIDIKTFENGKDVEFSVVTELYPQLPEVDLSKIKVTKRESEIAAADLDESLTKLLKFYRKWNPKAANEKAKLGDSVNIDYLGRIDKVEFEGGAAKGYQLELGSKSFIDDFEEQLVGKKAGDEVRVKVKFPKEYQKEEFAGKAAEFEVKINEVLSAEMPEINDEFIKNNFGLENKSKLEEAVKKQIEDNYRGMERNLFKKELFDFLNKKHDFELPEGLVEEQVASLWAETEEELKTNPNKFKNDKEKEKAKDKKREIAERMIRCGMILSDVAQKNKVEVTNDDLNQEIGKILARFPNQEKAVLDYYQKNAGAVQQLRGSIIEEKTIDFILSNPSLEKKKVSLKELDKLWQKAGENE
ncbi:MAG: trigger factor [Rickettsiales bacterium]|nr:trigger factor [Rickettsiales bacterium]